MHVLAPTSGAGATTTAAAAPRAVLATLGPGRCFGEMALLQPDGTRSTTVTVPRDAAAPGATCLVLGRDHFQALLHFSPAPAEPEPASPGSASGGDGDAEAAGAAAALVVAALVRERKLRALEQVPLLASLGRAALEAIVAEPSARASGGAGSGVAASASLLRTFKAGEVIATRGEAAHTMFVVHRGAVTQQRPAAAAAVSAAADGADAADCGAEGDGAGGGGFEMLGPGEYFGVDSLLTGEPLAATYVAGDGGMAALGDALAAMSPTGKGGSGGGDGGGSGGGGGGGCDVLVMDRGAFDRLRGASPDVEGVLQSHLASVQRRAVLRGIPLLSELTGFRDRELDAVAGLLR